MPTGCQTVFSSRNAEISHGLCSLPAWTTRFTFSAASDLELRGLVAGARDVDRVHVHVRGEDGAELGAIAGEEVDDAAGQIGRRDRLRELERRERRRLGRDDDGSVAAHDHRRDPRDEPFERRLLGCEHRDDAGRLRDGEVEVRPGDRVRAAEHLRQLVGPAGVPDDPIDRAFDLAPTRARAGEVRRRAPPSSRRADRAPGRGCTRRARPLREGRAGGLDGVARVLARGAGDVLPLCLVRASGLRARELRRRCRACTSCERRSGSSVEPPGEEVIVDRTRPSRKNSSASTPSVSNPAPSYSRRAPSLVERTRRDSFTAPRAVASATAASTSVRPIPCPWARGRRRARGSSARGRLRGAAWRVPISDVADDRDRRPRRRACPTGSTCGRKNSRLWPGTVPGVTSGDHVSASISTSRASSRGSRPSGSRRCWPSRSSVEPQVRLEPVAGRPRARSRTPCSRRTARSGRSG